MKESNQTFPIDIVIPWVDGEDPAWLSEKQAYQGDVTASVHSFDYKDWGLLRYWFRGIAEFAPWVRHVYFVTWGHLPAWLNPDAPKLRIVNHKDYIPKQYLPTFSSHAIELNLHRIRGLSEHFVYFNDDTYLIRPTVPEDFFRDGLPLECAVINPIAPANANCIAHLQLRTAGVINQHFNKRKVMRANPGKWFSPKYGKLLPLNFLFLPWGRFPGFLDKHLPANYLKSTFREVWKQEPELLDKTCSHRFRDFKTDVNQWVMKDWQLASGRFMPRSVNIGKLLNVSDAETAAKAAACIRGQKYKMLCVNDHIEGAADSSFMQQIVDSFEMILPRKSEFEK